MKKKVNLGEYREACDYYGKVLSLTKVLYDLCRKHPKHNRKASIHAKLWIIGRTYASGIERLGKTTGVQGSVLADIEDCLYLNRKEVNGIFARLAKISEPLNAKKIKIIVREHGRFVALLSRKLRQKRSARSFASKWTCPQL